MKFVLTGFTQNENIRHYSFQRIGGDRKSRTDVTVGVDMTLLLKHRIPLQEAPLLCSLLLASRAGDEQDPSFMIAEGDIRARAEQGASERAKSQSKRKPASLPHETPTPRPQSAPDFGSGKLGIGLGSRTGYPCSPQARKSLLSGDPNRNT